MYRLLIVDDMPIVADGIAGLLQGAAHLNLEVYKAYSGSKALDILRSEKIDIVLCDMKMPGMEGIDLLKAIRLRWPNCKVVFLTAYDDFEYVRSAMSLGGFEYILKIEDDRKIIRTIERAIDSLREESAARNLIQHADHKRAGSGDPASREACVWELVAASEMDGTGIADKLSELGCRFADDRPLIMILGSVDEGEQGPEGKDEVALLSAVQHVAEHYLSDFMPPVAVGHDRSRLFMLLQPRLLDEGDEPVSAIRGKLEPIRQTCRKLLDTRVVFALSDMPFGWEAVRGIFGELELAITRELAASGQPVPTETPAEPDKDGQKTGMPFFQLHKVRLLGEHLESGREADFDRLFDELRTFLLGDATGQLHKLECLHALNAVFVSSIVACGLHDELATLRDAYRRIQSGEERSWEDIQRQFRRIAATIFECKRNAANVNAHDFIAKIHAYIEAHSAEDLTLSTLAAHVNFNPSYFSRFYKQTTGIALSDYIADIRNAKAKELLKKPAMKIQDIAEKTGYHSSMAFIRFFKKQNGITPEEYRRRSLHASNS